MVSRQGAAVGLLFCLLVFGTCVSAERSQSSLLAELSSRGASMDPFYKSMQAANLALGRIGLPAGDLVKAYAHVAETTKATEKLRSVHGDAVVLHEEAERIRAEGDPDRVLSDEEHTRALDALAAFVRKALTFAECAAPTDDETALEENACSISHLDCENASVMDKNRCRCRCDAKTLWHGVFCETCEKTDKDCNNGKLVTEGKKCECSCEPADQWQGRTCEVCHLTDEKCVHGTADNGLCACVCDEPWATGDSFPCNKCAITDAHCNDRGEGVVSDECMCKCNKEVVKVRHPDGSLSEKNRWKGRFCEECNLVARDCNGQNFDASACQCTCKEQQWSGVTCHQCLVTEERCTKGKGKFNKDTCDCSKDCPPHFQPPDEASFSPTDIFCENCHLQGSTCQHNCALNVRKCTCETTTSNPWSGVHCEKCDQENNKCAHGEWSKEDGVCECVCPTWKSPEGAEFQLWFGTLCETCVVDHNRCLHGGRVDPATCRCTGCSPGWKGDHCHECALTANDCKHNSKFNEEECKCECDENGHWANTPTQAPTCSFCPPTAGQDLCQHGGEWNADTCSCIDCENLWEGNSCEVCKQQPCQHGGTFNMENCRCEDCSQWVGPLCEVCPITQAMCRNGGQLDRATCDCHTGCPEKWKGSLHCDSCVVAQANIAAGVGTRASSVDPVTCTPACSHPWSNPGNECRQCSASCQHGGSISTDSNTRCECANCSRGWSGRFCDTCTLQQGHCTANRAHGVDTGACRCRCNNGWISGQLCESCSIPSCHHGWADTTNCRCVCHAGATGAQCNQCQLCQNGTCINGRCQCHGGQHHEWRGRLRTWWVHGGIHCNQKAVVRQVNDDPHVECPAEATRLLDAPGDTRLSVFTRGEDKIEVHQYNAHNTELMGYGLVITQKEGDKTTTTKIATRVVSKGVDGTKEIQCCLNGVHTPGACANVPNLDDNSMEHEYMLHQQTLLTFIGQGSQLTVDSTAAETAGYSTETICSKDSSLLATVKDEDSPYHGCGWNDHMEPPHATTVDAGEKNALVDEFADVNFEGDIDFKYITDNFDKGLVCKAQTGLDRVAKDVILQKCLNDMPVRHMRMCRKINPDDVNNFEVGCSEQHSLVEATELVTNYLKTFNFKCEQKWQWQALWTCFDGGCEAASRKDMTDMADIREAAMSAACTSPEAGEAVAANAKVAAADDAAEEAPAGDAAATPGAGEKDDHEDDGEW